MQRLHGNCFRPHPRILYGSDMQTDCSSDMHRATPTASLALVANANDALHVAVPTQLACGQRGSDKCRLYV